MKGLKPGLNHIQRTGFAFVTESPATPEATKESYGENGLY